MEKKAQWGLASITLAADSFNKTNHLAGVLLNKVEFPIRRHRASSTFSEIIVALDLPLTMPILMTSSSFHLI